MRRAVALFIILLMMSLCLTACLNQESNVITSPSGETQIIVEYDFVSRPTVYKKAFPFNERIWSYDGAGFNETVWFDVEWLSEDEIRLYIDMDREKYSGESYIIRLDER